MSASSIETKDIAKSNCSSSSSKKNDSINSMTSLNLKGRMLQRKSQCRQAGLFSGNSTNGLNSDIRQRVVSARQHRYKNLQNQLNMVLQHNAELINENRLLKTLYKRQDNALAKYEGTTSELPQLINSHSEELRVWQTKYRTLNLQNRDLNKKIQQKDKILNELSDRVKYLTILTSERHLEEREVLSTKLNSLEKILAEKDEELKMLTRKNAIEAKNFKTQLANEKKKYKELCQKQNSNCDKQNVSSNDSDYSSAKDIKELKHIVSSLSAVSAISEETPLADLNANIGDDDDDDDNDELVIKRIIDKDMSIDNDDSQELIQQLADISLFANDESTNIHAIQQKIQRDIEKNEAFLDLHCDEISRDINAFTLPKEAHLFNAVGENGINRELENDAMNSLLMINSNRSDDSKGSMLINSTKSRASRTTSCLPRFNINVGGPKPLKRAPIDPQKKSKLLAQLKSIGSAHGGL